MALQSNSMYLESLRGYIREHGLLGLINFLETLGIYVMQNNIMGVSAVEK